MLFRSLSSIGVVSSAYLRLLIFLLVILIPACASSSTAFHMMYSAYELSKQGENNSVPIKSKHPIKWILSITDSLLQCCHGPQGFLGS